MNKFLITFDQLSTKFPITHKLLITTIPIRIQLKFPKQNKHLISQHFLSTIYATFYTIPILNETQKNERKITKPISHDYVINFLGKRHYLENREISEIIGYWLEDTNKRFQISLFFSCQVFRILIGSIEHLRFISFLKWFGYWPILL